MFPPVSSALKLQHSIKRVYIGSYGFEDRSLGWVDFQKEQGLILNHAMIFKYYHSKGTNRIIKLRKSLRKIGVNKPIDVQYNVRTPHNIEDIIDSKLKNILMKTEEIIIDVSAMTKLLILVSLLKLKDFQGTIRIVYTEAENYSPTKEEYEKSKNDMTLIAKYPSHGIESIIRMKCLSSIRMQGQPVILVAFTSFNEQLVRHMLGTMNPHRLLLINGHRSRKEYAWRETATQEIHKRLIDEYSQDNPKNTENQLDRSTSTLDYRDTLNTMNNIYKQYGTYERIICAVTGSKMQTVGLFFSKIAHQDIHIEYPTPDSYYVKEMTKGIHKVHEIVIPKFSEFIENIEHLKFEKLSK